MTVDLKDLLSDAAENDSPDPVAVLSELRRRTAIGHKVRIVPVLWRRPALVFTAVVFIFAGFSLPQLYNHRTGDNNAGATGSSKSDSANAAASAANVVARVGGLLVFGRSDGTSANLGSAQYQNAVLVPGSSGPNPYLMLYGPDVKSAVVQVGSPRRWECLSDAVVADTLYCQTTASSVTAYQAGVDLETYNLPTISPVHMPFLINGALPKGGVGLESRLVVNAVVAGPDGHHVALLADQRTSALLDLTSGKLTHVPSYSMYYAVTLCGSDLCAIGYDMSQKHTTLHVLRISTKSKAIVGDWDTGIQPDDNGMSIGEASLSMIGGAIMVTIPTTAAQGGATTTIEERESAPTTIHVWSVRPDGVFAPVKSPPVEAGRVSAEPYGPDSIIWWGQKPFNTGTLYSLTSGGSKPLLTSFSSLHDAIVTNIFLSRQ